MLPGVRFIQGTRKRLIGSEFNPALIPTQANSMRREMLKQWTYEKMALNRGLDHVRGQDARERAIKIAPSEERDIHTNGMFFFPVSNTPFEVVKPELSNLVKGIYQSTSLPPHLQGIIGHVSAHNLIAHELARVEQLQTYRPLFVEQDVGMFVYIARTEANVLKLSVFSTVDWFQINTSLHQAQKGGVSVSQQLDTILAPSSVPLNEVDSINILINMLPPKKRPQYLAKLEGKPKFDRYGHTIGDEP